MSQGTIRPTVDISHNVIPPSRAVDVDVRTQRPSQPHFVAGDTRKLLPLHVDVHTAPSSTSSSCVDIHTPSKRLYAAAHAPLAPPTTPVADLLCHERSVLSSTSIDSDSDYPPASQRENCSPGLGTQSRPPSPLSAAGSERSITSRSLYQLTQLATQLVTTVKDQLKSTRDDAAQRELRMFNDIAEREQRIVNDMAEREYRLLTDTAERVRRARELETQREQRLLDDTRHARELEVQREQILVRDAQSARQELLADIQLQRDREAQREIDMRRDLYDLSRQSSRAAALEAELKCLKANIGPSTVAYEVIDVPVQLDDIPPPESTAALQMSPLRPVTPIDNFAVQALPDDVTHRRPPITTVHRPDIAHAFTSNVHAVNPQSADDCYGANISMSQPLYNAVSISASQTPCLTFAMNASTVCRPDLQYQHHQPDTLHAHMPVRAFPRELPQPSVLGSHHVPDTSRMPAATAGTDHVHTHTLPRQLDTRAIVSDPVCTFSRSPPQPACTHSTMTSALPYQPVYSPPREEVLISALPRLPSLVRPPYREDVVTSALPHPPTRPPPSREDVVTSALPRPLPAAPDFAYDTMQRPAYPVDDRNVEQLLAQLPSLPPVHRQVPLSSAHIQTTASAYVNTDHIPVLSPHRYTSNLNSSSMVAFSPSVCTSYVDNTQRLPIAVDQPRFSAFSRTYVPYSRSTTVQYAVDTSVSTSIAPLQSPSVHSRQQLAYDYIQPDTRLGAPTHTAPVIHSGYIRPQTSDTHTHTHIQIVCTCKTYHLETVI